MAQLRRQSKPPATRPTWLSRRDIGEHWQYLPWNQDVCVASRKVWRCAEVAAPYGYNRYGCAYRVWMTMTTSRQVRRMYSRKARAPEEEGRGEGGGHNVGFVFLLSRHHKHATTTREREREAQGSLIASTLGSSSRLSIKVYEYGPSQLRGRVEPCSDHEAGSPRLHHGCAAAP